MKILMLCIEFPPVNTTGNYRSAGFARFLCNNNVETFVFTATVDTLEKAFNKKPDSSLLKGLEKAKIHRFPIAAIKPFWTKGIGDKIRIWWNISDKIDKRWYFGENKKKIDAIISEEKPDVLYVSLPPFSMARTAIAISKKFKIPLVTDMRDAWSLWVSLPFSTRFHYKKVRRVERQLFEQSKLVLAVTPELVEDFREQHSHINPEKFVTIFNGYDDLNLKQEEVIQKDSLYRIGYTGSFYYHPDSENVMDEKWYKRSGLKKLYYTPRKEQWKYRSPFFFLKTMSILLEKTPELKSKLVFEYVGAAPHWLNSMVDELGLKHNFISHGFVSKKEVLKIQNSWDATLATSEKVKDGQHFCLPSKLFDIVNSKKRILAFLTPGSQLNFLKNYRQTVFFKPDEFDDNVLKLKDLIENNNVNFEADELSKSFHRENTAKQFYEELMKL